MHAEPPSKSPNWLGIIVGVVIAGVVIWTQCIAPELEPSPDPEQREWVKSCLEGGGLFENYVCYTPGGPIPAPWSPAP